MRYTLSRPKFLGLGLVLLGSLFATGEIQAVTTTNVMTAYEYAELGNCVIPVGASTCTATLAIHTPTTGQTYTVRNINRGVISSNIITPNNYIPYGSTYAYVLNLTDLADAANRLTFGNNSLTIIPPGTAIPSFSAVGSASCATGSAWNGQMCAASTTTYNDITIEATNCTIAVGESKCASTFRVTSTKYLGTTGGRMFDLKNLTRGLTTSNLFTPNNVTLNPAGYPVYTVSTSIMGDAANYATNGGNDFVLIEGGVSVAKATMTASCASGSTWNGQKCAAPVVPSPTGLEKLTVVGCTIAAGSSVCTSVASISNVANNKLYDLYNETTGITTSNAFITLNQYYFNPSYAGSASELKYGSNTLRLRSAGEMTNLTSTTVTVTCVTGSSWNGQVCASINPPGTSGSIMSKVTLKTGNGDTTYSFDLPNNISKNYYLPDQVEKKVMIPSTTSILNLTLTSTKERCSISPNYLADTGESFSSNAKDYMQPQGQNINQTVPVFAALSNPISSSTLYGKLSSITISCDNYNDVVKDLLIFKVSYVSPLPPTPVIELQATTCVIPLGKSTCISTVSMTPVPEKFYSLENSTRGLTMTNAFRPGVASISTSVLGEQASNYLTYGANTLNLRDGTTLVTSTQVTTTCAAGSTWNGQMCATEITPPTNNYVTIEAKSCVIPAGKSTCPATVSVTSTKYIGTTGGRTFDLKNATRGLTTSNLFSPGNTTLNSAGYPVYTVTTNASGDAANYAINGANDLTLIEGGISVAKTSVTASCAVGSTWNGQICSTDAIACTTVVKFCIDGSVMPRDPNCGWHPEQCSVDKPIQITGYTIGTRTYQIGTTGIPVIELPEGSSITFIGTAKPSTVVYFYRDGSADMISNTASATSGQWSISTAMSSVKNIIISGTNTYTFGSIPPVNIPQTSLVAGSANSIVAGDPYSIKITIKVVAPTSNQKPSINFLNRSPKVLSSGQTMYLSWGTSNANSFSYFCKGNGSVANKKVSLDLNKATYGSSWSTLIAEGWSGVYQCEFTAEGPGGSTTLADNFAILPTGSAGNPGSNYTDFQANNCTIPLGKSTCASTLYVTAPAGKYFYVKNLTRGITTSNLLTPNNYTFIAGMNSPVYTVTTNTVGDAANYATNGGNDFVLYDSASTATVVAKATMTASCESGSTWNGKMCATPGTLPPSSPLTITCSKSSYLVGEAISCKIQGGSGTKTCWQKGTSNTVEKNCSDYGWTPGIGTLDLYYAGTVTSSVVGTYTLYVKDATGKTASTQVSYLNNSDVVCEPGLVWNGQMCIPPKSPPTPIPPTQSGGILPYPTTPSVKMANCVIPEGGSTCASTLFVFAQSGQTFTVKNVTRNIVSADVLTPNNYYVVAGRGVYILKSNSDSVLANQLSFGINYISVTQNSSLSKTLRTRAIARCDILSTWNGTKCVSKIPTEFSIKTYETARGTKTYGKVGITFDPVLDKYLTIRGVGPIGSVEIYQGGSTTSVVSGMTDGSGKWKLTLTAENFAQSGEYSYMLWDGKNASTSMSISLNVTTIVRNPVDPVSPTTRTPVNPSALPVEMVTLGN